MARKYTLKPGFRIWPVNMFCILYLVTINAYVLYKKITGNNTSRRDFLFQTEKEKIKCK